MADLSEKHQTRPVSPVLALLIAVVFGFIAGLGGTLLLSQPLLRQSLQKQQEENAQMNRLLEKRMAEVHGELAVHQQELQTLRQEMDASLSKGSRSSRNELLKIQQRLKEVKQESLVWLTQLEKRLVQLEEAGKQTCQSLNLIHENTDALDKEQKEKIRQLENRIADLENKVAQSLRTTP